MAQVLRARLLAAISETEELDNFAGEGVGVGMRYRPDNIFALENLGSGLNLTVAVVSLRSSEYGSCQYVTFGQLRVSMGRCAQAEPLCSRVVGGAA